MADLGRFRPLSGPDFDAVELLDLARVRLAVDIQRQFAVEPRAELRHAGLVQPNRPDRLPMRVRHGPVALDVPDDAAGGVPNLDAPPVARVVQVSDDLA